MNLRKATMTDFSAVLPRFIRSVRIFLAISGALALIAGIVLLVWPGKTAVLVTGVFASYLIIAGLLYISLGIFSGSDGGWVRAGHILLGLLFVATGVVAFANLAVATVRFAMIVAILIGISWIIDGIVALSLTRHSTSKIWSVLYAVLGVGAGVAVLLSPLYAAALLWTLLGIALVVLGIMQIVRAITMRKVDPITPVDAAL